MDSIDSKLFQLEDEIREKQLEIHNLKMEKCKNAIAKKFPKGTPDSEGLWKIYLKDAPQKFGFFNVYFSDDGLGVYINADQHHIKDIGRSYQYKIIYERGKLYLSTGGYCNADDWEIIKSKKLSTSQ